MAEKTKAVRPEKEAIVSEIKAKFSDATCAMLVDFKGITVAQASDIRRELSDLDALLFIAKNRLIERALKDKSYLVQWQEGLNECSAIVTGTGDAVATAKVLSKFHKENGILEVKSGMLDGMALSGDEVKQLAELPGKNELRGHLVATLAAPMRQIAGVFHQKIASVVYVLKAVQDKKEAA